MAKTCPACASPAAEAAKFCAECGTKLLADAAGRDVRKSVTALFCDLVGSTSLGEHVDPEALRALMDRYFETMRSVLERHAGTVEKFIGDAVVAFFGVPTSHEDDALRAVRAAFDMHEALGQLNEELDATWGVRLAARIGLNTGEVLVSGSAEATIGDAVNTAARFEQAAGPGEVLVGESTWRLVEPFVEGESLPPLVLKGKQQPIAAWRITSVLGIEAGLDAGRRHTVIVGREREMEMLNQALARAASDRACQLFTVFGAAGAGKSRLAREFADAVPPGVRCISGRCLSYGDGTSLWPLLEILRSAADLRSDEDDDAGRARLAVLMGASEDAAQVVELLAPLAGLEGTPPPLDEVRWAVRRLVEVMGQADPVVVIVEDLHWAQPAVLAVLEEICDWSRDAAILVLGLARPEFLDGHPQWGGGKLNATSALLTPLEDDVCEALLRELLDGGELPRAASRQVINAAGGNPLFLEQLLSMLLDDGSFECHEGEWRVARDLGEIAVPPSISALLAARLDRLNAEERQVLESASVVGQSFYTGAVAELSGLLPAAVAGATRSLMRKELVRRAPSDISGEEGLAFTHVLVADAAYLSVPKRRRADLHERFARWFDKQQSATIGDVDEFVGHHFMRAVQLRRELGRLGPSDRELAVQGAQRLVSAARRQRLTDSVAAAQLFGRAAELREGEPEEIELRRRQGAELLASQAYADARELLERCLAAAEAIQDPGLLARVRLTWIEAALHTEPRVEYDRCEELVESAVHEIDPDDDESFVMVHRARQRLLNLRSLWDDMVVTAENIMFHASRCGDKATYDEAYGWRMASLMYGARPVSELVAELDHGDQDDPDPGGVYWYYRQMIRLVLLAYEDRFDEVQQMLAELQDGAKTVRARWVLAHFDFMQVLTHLVLGDDAALEQVTRRMITEMESAGELSLLSTLAPILGEVMVRRGELDEAWSLAETGRSLAMAEDADSQAQWRSIEATVLATRGQHVEAKRLADEAVALMETTQHVDWIAQTFVTRARVHELAGHSSEAVEDLDRAIRIFDAKGNVPGGRRARQQRETLGASP